MIRFDLDELGVRGASVQGSTFKVQEGAFANAEQNYETADSCTSEALNPMYALSS